MTREYLEGFRKTAETCGVDSRVLLKLAGIERAFSATSPGSRTLLRILRNFYHRAKASDKPIIKYFRELALNNANKQRFAVFGKELPSENKIVSPSDSRVMAYTDLNPEQLEVFKTLNRVYKKLGKDNITVRSRIGELYGNAEIFRSLKRSIPALTK